MNCKHFTLVPNASLGFFDIFIYYNIEAAKHMISLNINLYAHSYYKRFGVFFDTIDGKAVQVQSTNKIYTFIFIHLTRH